MNTVRLIWVSSKCRSDHKSKLEKVRQKRLRSTPRRTLGTLNSRLETLEQRRLTRISRTSFWQEISTVPIFWVVYPTRRTVVQSNNLFRLSLQVKNQMLATPPV